MKITLLINLEAISIHKNWFETETQNTCSSEFGESTLRQYGNHCDSVNCIVLQDKTYLINSIFFQYLGNYSLRLMHL